MIKLDIINEVVNKTGITKTKAETAVETVFESMKRALAKGDRLDIRSTGRDCSHQTWPNFEVSCLRVAGSKTIIRHARLVTTDRTP